MNFLAMPLTIFGLMLGVAAPMARGAKLLALLALFLALFMFFLYCPGNVGVFVFEVAHVDSPKLEAAIPILNLAGVAGVFAEFTMFFFCIFYLRACAVTFNQPRIGTSALMLLLTGFFWIAMACGVGGFVVFSTTGLSKVPESDQVLGEFRQLGQIPLILSIALNVLGLFWLLHYFITISRSPRRDHAQPVSAGAGVTEVGERNAATPAELVDGGGGGSRRWAHQHRVRGDGRRLLHARCPRPCLHPHRGARIFHGRLSALRRPFSGGGSHPSRVLVHARLSPRCRLRCRLGWCGFRWLGPILMGAADSPTRFKLPRSGLMVNS